MPHRLASDGFLVAARRREIWVGWEWASYLLRATLEATLTWRLLLRRATATAFDDTAGQIARARETPLGLRPWGSSVMADYCSIAGARPHVRRHHGTQLALSLLTMDQPLDGEQPWEVRGVVVRHG